jgi:hypothetical protein
MFILYPFEFSLTSNVQVVTQELVDLENYILKIRSLFHKLLILALFSLILSNYIHYIFPSNDAYISNNNYTPYTQPAIMEGMGMHPSFPSFSMVPMSP